MPSTSLAAILLAVTLTVLGPLTAPLERKIYRANLRSPAKIAAYGLIMALSWGLLAVAVAIYGVRPLVESVSAPTAWLPTPTAAIPLLAILVGGFVTLSLLPMLQSLRGLRYRRAYAAAFRRHTAGFAGLMPNNSVECAAFVLVSLTAGVCEETLYRGFLIRFLHEGALALPIAAALAVSSLIFGLNHAYQGVRGVISTTLVGVALGLVFLLSGSLWPAIVLHALIDAQAAYVLRPIPGEDAPTPEAATA